MLVDNSLLDSYGVIYFVYVESTMEINQDLQFLDSLHFVWFLMDCHSQIAQELSKDEKIVTENILQFNKEGSKITLRVLYTCLEDITHP